MSNIKKATRLNNGAGTLSVVAGDTTWGVTRSRIFTVTTTNATETTLATIALDDDTVTKLDVLIVARNTGAAEGAQFNLSMGYLRDGGAPVAIGTVTSSDARSTSGATTWTATIDVSSNDARVRVTGANSTNINWTAIVQEIKGV